MLWNGSGPVCKRMAICRGSSTTPAHGILCVRTRDGQPWPPARWEEVRQFATRQEWVDKAPTWITRGDICIDAAGYICYVGGDFCDAEFPVRVMRPSKRKRQEPIR